MFYTAIIMEIACLLFPITAVIVRLGCDLSMYVRQLRSAFFVFLLYDILFYLGYSLRGDVVDYSIFALEYLLFCVVTLSAEKFRVNMFLSAVIFIVGIIVQILGALLGTVGFLGLLFIAGDMEAESAFNFRHNGNKYQVRSYGSGNATTRYDYQTLDLYRTYTWIPVEHKTSEIVLRSDTCNLNMSDSFSFSISEEASGRSFVVKSGSKPVAVQKLK